MRDATDGRSWHFEFGEKGGKRLQVPCRHDPQEPMGHDLRAVGLQGHADKSDPRC